MGGAEALCGASKVRERLHWVIESVVFADDG